MIQERRYYGDKMMCAFTPMACFFPLLRHFRPSDDVTGRQKSGAEKIVAVQILFSKKKLHCCPKGRVFVVLPVATD